MASARVRSPRAWCQLVIGSWLVTMVERRWLRSSITSSRSAAWARAQARKLLPAPVGPTISRFW